MDANSGDISISLSVLFGTISINRNILNEGDISTQTFEFPPRLINESVGINRGEIVGRGDYLQITGDVWSVNRILQTLSYCSPPNGNGYDFIVLSAWDNGNSGIGFSNETITFVLQVNIIAQNDPPVISINGTELGLLYDNSSVWEVGVVSTPENVALKLGDYFQISDPDFNASNIIGDLYELNELNEINGQHYPTPLVQSLLSRDVFSSEMFFVSLSVQHGAISLATKHNLFFLPNKAEIQWVIDGWSLANISQYSAGQQSNREVNFFGNYFDVIYAAASAVYTPDQDWFGVDLCTIIVNDMGNVGGRRADFNFAGTGGVRHLTRKIVIDVPFVNSGPVFSSIPEVGTLTTVEDMVGIIGTDCCNWVAGDYSADILAGSTADAPSSGIPAIDTIHSGR
jgi:hypothetical protein